MRLLFLVACSVILACLPAAAAAPTADPRGIWLVEDKSAQIDIENCNGVLWGVVVWERNAGRDTENPDPALRGRPTLGIPILLGMRPTVQQGPAGAQTIWRGQIYNARSGQTYDANIRMVSPDVLHLEGCVLGGLFCGGQDWVRVRGPAPAPSGAGATAARAPGAAEVCSRISDLARGTH
jgi:uncharacterized protein (DUF2147 family)